MSQADACTLFQLNLFHFQNEMKSNIFPAFGPHTLHTHSKSILKNILVKILTVQLTDCSARALHARKSILIIMFAPSQILFKGNYIVQIHFNYSYKLRILFQTGRFAYCKIKNAKKLS